MTDAEIEAIARLYCRKLGLDPDMLIYPAWATVPEVAWRRQLPAVISALAMSEAIAEVRATVTEGGV